MLLSSHKNKEIKRFFSWGKKAGKGSVLKNCKTFLPEETNIVILF
jgi:hypothetical protein